MKQLTNQLSFLPRSTEWTMSSVWNDALAGKAERPAAPRARLWASELGKPNIEVFLKLRGIEPSNPPNARAKRKFEAGNMFEWIVGLVLKRAGILQEAQGWLEYQYPDLLPVVGKSDFKAGGIPDYEHYKEHLKELELPPFFMAASQAIIENFAKKYPEGLGDLYLEIKSCSSFIMDAMERTKNASKNHRLQLFHYLKASDFPRGNIVYICRDDLRMMEIPVMNPSAIEEEYKKSIAEITRYYAKHERTPIEKFLIKPERDDIKQWTWVPLEGLPPLEKNIIWDEDFKKFSRNWGVEYSSYLTMLYGYETQKEFEDEVMPMVGKWNRVIGRLKKGDKITPKNLEVIEEIKSFGYDPETLAKEYANGGIEEEVIA